MIGFDVDDGFAEEMTAEADEADEDPGTRRAECEAEGSLERAGVITGTAVDAIGATTREVGALSPAATVVSDGANDDRTAITTTAIIAMAESPAIAIGITGLQPAERP